MGLENFKDPLAERGSFLLRLLRYGLVAVALILVSLALGTLGYHAYAGLGWVDSILNASMILTGMGPVAPLRTTGAKLFASAYAIFSGVAFLSTVSVFLAPVAHRFLHRLHLDEIEDDDDDNATSRRA